MMLGWETLNRALQSMYLNHTASVSCVLKIQVCNTTSSRIHYYYYFCVCVYVVLETAPMVFHILSSALP